LRSNSNAHVHHSIHARQRHGMQHACHATHSHTPGSACRSEADHRGVASARQRSEAKGTAKGYACGWLTAVLPPVPRSVGGRHGRAGQLKTEDH